MRDILMNYASLILAAVFPTALFAANPGDKQPVDFQKEIAPLLEKHCLSCHAGKNAKGQLDLSRREKLLQGGDSGPAIVPGKPANSPLIDAISGAEPEMPKNGRKLSAHQIELLKRWISQGAKWPKSLTLKDSRREWWSFKPLKKTQVPTVSLKDRHWIRTPIDAFILQKLRRNRLHPSPQADRRTLIRRLSFDLHGLPPTPQDIQAFLSDRSPNAYERLVDRLLASPRYGERWGRHWLDVVHYGDTHGFDKDKRRPHAWPYRDYVIRAFNEDKPYGQFIREQLAGDMLPNAGPQGIVATGFIVAGPWDFVGHVELREGTLDKKITRNLDRDDMVMNTMSTFNSLTVHCARCHDHKFDPISQREYYRLQAVFAGVERAIRPYDVDEKTARLRAILTKRLQLLKEQSSQFNRQIVRKAGPELKQLDEKIARILAAPKGKTRPEFGYHSRIEQQQNVTKWVQVDLGKPTKLDRIVIVGCHDTYAGIGAGFGFPVRYKVEVSSDPSFKQQVTIIHDRTRQDAINPGVTPQTFKANGISTRFIRVTATKLAHRKNDYIFALGELLAITSDGKNIARGKKVTSLDSIEAPVRWRRQNLVDGYSYGTNSKVSPVELAKLKKQRDELWQRTLHPKFRKELARLTSEIQTTEAQLAKLPPLSLVYAAASQFKRQGNFIPPPNGKPRPIHVLNRGSVKSPGAVVKPGTVNVLPQLPSSFDLNNPDNEGTRRLALANWLSDKRNPLTWRSIVNRIWQYHFGRGIVDSPNDFGRMGSQPSHPELLDWLAIHFRDSGQSLKQLHRLIVTSAVYRQVSYSDPLREKIDGSNRFLWRMHRRRLEAEAIRDTVLAISAQLESRMYGPGFDRFGFENDHSPRYLYDRQNLDDPQSRRRTVYRFIVRSVPDPFMESLDCADPSLNVPKRNTTITALQALALLNNRFMVYYAEQFAHRLKQSSPTTAGQITAAFQLALGRDPTSHELALLSSHVKKHGLANCCRLIFNMNEFLFVD
ncbi:MAG: DUF1553 domain-containing protein [Planctomycetaceae bacterium]